MKDVPGVDLDLSNHVELGDWAAELGVDHALERAHDLVAVRLHPCAERSSMQIRDLGLDGLAEPPAAAGANGADLGRRRARRGAHRRAALALHRREEDGRGADSRRSRRLWALPG